MTPRDAEDEFARALKALSVASDALLTAAWQQTEWRWRRLNPHDRSTWPPPGDYLLWNFGPVVSASSQEAPQNSSGRIWTTGQYESKWPDDSWWMPFPPQPPDRDP